MRDPGQVVVNGVFGLVFLSIIGAIMAVTAAKEIIHDALAS